MITRTQILAGLGEIQDALSRNHRLSKLHDKVRALIARIEDIPEDVTGWSDISMKVAEAEYEDVGP